MLLQIIYEKIEYSTNVKVDQMYNPQFGVKYRLNKFKIKSRKM